jgi:hypothetical protein
VLRERRSRRRVLTVLRRDDVDVAGPDDGLGGVQLAKVGLERGVPGFLLVHVLQ